jgi:hypothetical protein
MIPQIAKLRLCLGRFASAHAYMGGTKLCTLPLV